WLRMGARLASRSPMVSSLRNLRKIYPINTKSRAVHPIGQARYLSAEPGSPLFRSHQLLAGQVVVYDFPGQHRPKKRSFSKSPINSSYDDLLVLNAVNVDQRAPICVDFDFDSTVMMDDGEGLHGIKAELDSFLFQLHV